MDIYDYIKKDHRAVADLMQQLLDDRDMQRRRELFARIRKELLLHIDSEEVTFYKAIEQASSAPPVAEKMDHAEDEHQEIRDYLSRLSGLDMHDESWIETFGEFKHAVSHHVAEEESEVWKKARACLNEAQAQQLADDMAAVKRDMKAYPSLPGNMYDKPSRSRPKSLHHGAVV
ncbi:hemerythrin domain-containing protein [Asticcacaulis sp. EMRT-3]|uniref:hemerythrin domain-containing protein n=1 Tax=Asticcacaulis sp. EMRT-3 TaxID=3040349 RepID=UPI0024AEEC4E|nr:hemerythrin domain-containing protein [Asticcacaulis sp. EMRT-3]MDI7775342.1 hemerythrin domain-containing protein [Asticcacaulis sp. EMRT-3]